MGAVCVLDIGKTNVKVVLFDAAGEAIGQRNTANRAQPGPPDPRSATGAWSAPIASASSAVIVAGIPSCSARNTSLS